MPVQIQKEEEKEPEVIYTSPEEHIKALIAKLKRLKMQRSIRVCSLEMQIQDLQDEIRDLARDIDIKIEATETDIRAIVLTDIKHTVKTIDGQVSYRKGSVRQTYDREALDAISDVNIRNILDRHKRKTESEPSVKIEVY